MVHSIITREQALEIEKKHIDYYKKLEEKYNKLTTIESIREFIKNKYNLKSITEFICKLTQFEMTKDLLKFKNHLQSVIKDDGLAEGHFIPKKVYLVYFALKDFIRSKRLELLYKMRDEGVKECLKEYPHSRIKDTILNTKWKYMNKAFSPSNPIVDRNNNAEYKNIKEAIEASGCSIENIKSNIGYTKRWIYISDYTQFLNALPVRIRRPRFKGKECIFHNINEASDVLVENKNKITYCINNKKMIFVGRDKTKCEISSISLEEQFMLSSPLIINGDKYSNIYDASISTRLPVKTILRNYGGGNIGKMDCNISLAIDTSRITKDKQLPFEEDKKFASEMYKKIKEIRDRHSLQYIF